MDLIQVCSFTEGAAVLLERLRSVLSQASEEMTLDVVTLGKVIGYEDNLFFSDDYILFY